MIKLDYTYPLSNHINQKLELQSRYILFIQTKQNKIQNLKYLYMILLVQDTQSLGLCNDTYLTTQSLLITPSQILFECIYNNNNRRRRCKK